MWAFSFFSAVSILALGCALGQYRFSPSTGVIAWLTVAIGALALAVCVRPGLEAEERARRSLPFVSASTLGLFAAFQLVFGSLGIRNDVSLWLLGMGVAFLYFLFQPKGLTLHVCRTRIFPLVLLGFLVIGVRTIRKDRNPPIDVFLLQQAAAKALVKFQNPYTATIPDIYGPGSIAYIPMVENGQTLYGFGYPPLMALLELPSYLLTGDVRYTHVLAFLLSSCLIALMQPSWVSLCSAVLLLINPFSLMMIEYAWIEPVVILLLCITLFSASRYPKAVPYLFGLFLATKQPLLALLPFAPLLIEGPWEWKKIASFLLKSLAVVGILYIPFFLWNTKAFVTSLITVQLRVPMRTDLISYTAYAAARNWFLPPIWLPFVYLPVAIYLGLRKAPRTPAGFAAASALLFIPFFAISKQGSPNYHFLGMGMMCCALGLATSSRSQAAETTDQKFLSKQTF